MPALYDSIGRNYSRYRRPDPRIARRIDEALGDARRVINVGAGTGSYEPAARSVVAVEPSFAMIRQRRIGAAPAVQGDAIALPVRDASFDAALAILTIHHWSDRARGVAELERVARERVVILTWDPAAPGFWLTEYFPEILDIDRRIFPELSELERLLGSISVRDVRIPHDCSDGFLGAHWRRPAAYLDPGVRSAISTFGKLSDAERGLRKLRDDLRTGAWHDRYRDLLERGEMDLGYRLVVARLRPAERAGLRTNILSTRDAPKTAS